MIQVSVSVCMFIILIGPFIIIFNIVSDIRGWDKTFPALADADIKQMTKCRGIPDVFLYLESVIHFAQIQCLLTFETSLRKFVAFTLLFCFRTRISPPRRRVGRPRRAPRTTPSPSTVLSSRTRFSEHRSRTSRSPRPRPTRGCRCSSPRRTGTCSRTGRGAPTSSTSPPRHTPSHPSPPRASSSSAVRGKHRARSPKYRSKSSTLPSCR